LLAATPNLVTENGPLDQGKEAGGAHQAVWMVAHGSADQVVLRAVVIDHGKGNGEGPVDSMAIHTPQ
jgi:hypothetical protein